MRLLMFLLAALGTLGLVAPAPAAGPPAGWRARTAAESVEAIDRLAAEAVDPAGPCAAVLVMRGGKVVLMKGYGLADLDKKTPVSPTTTFELASLSKPFTSLAVLILAERGRLHLADDVRKYIPELPAFDKKRPIRITDLLQHTSGVPDHLGWREVGGLTPRTALGGFSSRTSADFIKMLARGKLDFPTGSKWAYSNMNYRLLAVVVERVSGKSLPAFLKAEVFDPLGMKHTFVRTQRRPAVKGRAVGYMKGLGLLPSWKYRSVRTEFVLVGEAGVWSCVEDLARFEQELRRPTLVRRASLERAWTPGKLDNGKPVPYGLGWEVGGSPFGRTVGHSGSWPGFTTYFLRLPERDVAVAVLRNYWDLPRDIAAIELARRSAGLLLVDRPRAGGPKLTDAEGKVLPGVYRVEGAQSQARVEVVRRKEGLYLVLPGQSPYPLVRVSRTHFYIDGTDGQHVVFELEGGAVRRLRLELKGGRPIVAFRPAEKSGQAKLAKKA
jgi:CubicO group peptidase (beta-lactamase class C family)